VVHYQQQAAQCNVVHHQQQAAQCTINNRVHSVMWPSSVASHSENTLLLLRSSLCNHEFT
jgi:hypothetical protein